MQKQIKIKGLYVIVDPSICEISSILDTTDAILSGGANILQYRDKLNPIKKQLEIAKNIKNLCEKYSTVFIINDNAELAVEVEADGIHIGQEDIPLDLAKTIINSNQIIGTSNNNLNQILDSHKNKADYIAIGALFPTKTMGKANRKIVGTNLIKKAKDITDKPIIAIGGIKKNNIHKVIDAGADGICIVSEIISHPNPELITKEFADIIHSKLK